MDSSHIGRSEYCTCCPFLPFLCTQAWKKRANWQVPRGDFFYLEVKTEMLGNPAWLEGNLALY